ncbi:MAG: transposase [Oscillospiraceae bacterium]|nr:transposase [Oscillospiraceae bacterium]
MDLPKRKPTRLKDYDYSSEGAYFITICAHNKQCIFSSVVGAIHESPESVLNENGKVVDDIIKKLNDRFDIIIDKYVIMPNHIHLIVVIDENPRAIRESPLQKRSLISKAMGYLKMNASKQIHKTIHNQKVWQRSFHDHVIRDERDYLKIWNYIDSNPAKWNEDCFFI